ncbi:AAA family ATPase, partial [Cronobacter dublinensis]|nr:AAA family ATPase [Cronobacter dublinensis]
MIKGISVANFRSFKEKTTIDLRPITVFVGKNSSGKSSLLRTFPLFRQSIEENTTGPILWYGRYVDFGDFDEIKSNGSDSNHIEFNFDITISDTTQHLYSVHRYWLSTIPDIDVRVRLIVHSKDKKTKTREVAIEFPDVNIIISLDDNDNAKLIIKSGNEQIERDGLTARNLGQFIPHLTQKKNKEEQISSTNKRYLYGHNDRALENYFIESAARKIQGKFHNKTDFSGISNALSRIGFMPFDNLTQILETIFKEQKTFTKNFLHAKKEITSDIYPFLLGYNINNIAELINRTLNETFNNVKYIAPLRATSERFYRF